MANLRKIILRVLLWALGIAAVFGAGAVLTGGGDIAWRVISTALCSAGAAMVMLPMTLLADREKGRNAGVFGIVLVVVEFLLAMVLTWDLDGILPGRDENYLLTMVWLALCGLPTIFFLSLTERSGGRIAGWTGAALGAMVFALLMVGSWSSRYWFDDEKWFETAGAVAGLGILGVAALAGMDITSGASGTARRFWWRWIGVAGSIIAIAVATYAIWFNISSGSGAFVCIVSIAAIVAHANLCLLCPLSGSQRWVRIVTIAAAVVSAACIDVMAIGGTRSWEVSPLANLAGAAGIIAGCGSLALAVLARLNRNNDRVPVLSEIRQIKLLCPACRRKQTLNISADAGRCACTNCGLLFNIRIEEPRCPKCNYVLLMLRSDRCPECGTPLQGSSSSFSPMPLLPH